VSKTHNCGNCIMWSKPPGSDLGVCEVGDMQPLQGFDGNGVDTDQGFRTTPDTYCDYQVPIPVGETCPACGQQTLFGGFGLAGGGYGSYVMCDAPACGHFEKWQCADDEA
jgi:hypothetical protein